MNFIPFSMKIDAFQKSNQIDYRSIFSFEIVYKNMLTVKITSKVMKKVSLVYNGYLLIKGTVKILTEFYQLEFIIFFFAS